MLREAVSQVQLPWDADRQDQCESDAWDAVRRDVEADALHPDLPDVDAGKSADLERDAQAQDGSPSGDSQSAVPAGLVEPCRPGAGQSAERSCAVPASADAQAHSAARPRRDAVAELEVHQAHLPREHWAKPGLKHSFAAAAESLDSSVPDAEVPQALLLLELAAVLREPQEARRADAVPQLWPE